MRRQETWLKLADRIGEERHKVVAICVFLNMGWSLDRICYELGLKRWIVDLVAEDAKPLLRQSRRPQLEKTGVCAYCGSGHDITKDHVIPRSRGGANTPENIVWACRNCNSAKGDRTPEEWLA